MYVKLSPKSRRPYRRTLCSAVLVCVCITGVANHGAADTSITVNLPPSAAARQLAHQLAKADMQRKSAQHQDRLTRYSSPPSRGSEQRNIIVGKLGEIVAAAVIHREARWNSRTICSATAGTYVAIKQQSGSWDGILMEDGTIGWLQDANIQHMDGSAVLAQTPLLALDSAAKNKDVFPHGTSPLFNSSPYKLMQIAYGFLGVPYEWGGNTHQGIDCSGFVKRVFAALGYELPRTADEQIDVGVPVLPEDLRCGDRLYFELSRDGSRVKHTGIYLGNGYFIHSSVTRHGVAISNLATPIWRNLFVCARR